MRKVSSLALLLSLLLGASFCLTACDDKLPGFGDSSSYSSYDEEQTPEQLEEEANKTYAERIAKWTKYVEYAAPEANDVLEYTSLTEKDTAASASHVWANNGDKNQDLYEVTDATAKEGSVEVSPDVFEQRGLSVEYSQKLYNATTDALVLDLTSVEYAVDGGKLLDTTKKRSDQVENTIFTNMYEGFVIVQTKTYELREAEEPAVGEEPEVVDDTLVSNYNAVTVYAVYDKNGNKLHEKLTTEDIGKIAVKEASDEDDWKSHKFVSIADKTYAVLDGEIIKTFVRDTQYDVPEYTEEVEHSYFTYGDCGYYVIESDPQMMQIGDFAMARVPGVSIEVINAKKELAWKYATTSYHVAGYSILSDGDIYICEYKMLEAGATEFDIESAGIKFDVIHSRIDVETGAVTQLEKDFIAQKVYNNVTPEITTLLNIAATAEVLGNCKVKDGYMLAQVQTYADGVLDSKQEIAVLDEEMNIVEILPKIIDNQFGYVGFLNSDTMLVNTMTTSSRSICYTADTKTGDLELYFNVQEVSSLQYIEGGFIYNEKLYDYDWNVKFDLSYRNENYDSIDYTVKGNTVYIEATRYIDGYYGGETQTTFMVGYFAYEYGSYNFVTKTLSTYENDNVTEYDDCYVVTYDYQKEIYDAYGNIITTVSTSDTYSNDEYYLDEDPAQYNRVTYRVVKSMTINEIGDTDTYLVCVTENWSLSSYYDLPEGKHDKSGTYKQYYILK